jgi:RNA polymerase sigma-70 factor (ECF subfamily)
VDAPLGGEAAGEESSEEWLMAAYAAGDEAAFTRLFASLAPKVYGFFLRSFRDPSVSEELLQTTFFNIHRARGSYRPELPVRPWAFTIAAHVRRDEMRRRQRLKEDPGEEALAAAAEARAFDAVAEVERGVGQRDVEHRLRAALDALPESQRIVIHLHRYEGMTFGEIAGVLSTSEVAVRGRAFRAYAQLRKQLADLFEGSES